MSGSGDVRPRPSYWLCRSCGGVAIVDRSRLDDWQRSSRACGGCGVAGMMEISARVYRIMYDAQVAAIAPTTREDVERSSMSIDDGVAKRRRPGR